MSNQTTVRPFRVEVPEGDLVELRRRIDATRWPERETVGDDSQGVPLATMQDLARYWATEYDWRTCEARLNALPQFMTEIDGLDIHFVHVRSKHEDALPLVVCHGWPGSPVEQLKLIGPLTDPTAHGASASDAFHLVIPSMPGHGFSGKPTDPGWGPVHIGKAYVELMRRLGYTRFVAQGGDWGLVPGFPLDGGRLLRSAIWKATGSLGRATRIASLSGQGVGWLLVAAGVAFLLAGDLAGGIWFAFIGWFLVQAARSSYQDLQLQQLLGGVEAEEVMAGDLVRVPPELSLQQAVDDYFMVYDHSGFPVEEGGRTIGLLTLRGVRRVPREQWPTRRVRDHMVPLGDQVVVAPDARMDGVVGKLQDGEANRVLVVEDGEVVGIITPTDLTRWLRRWQTLEGSAP